MVDRVEGEPVATPLNYQRRDPAAMQIDVDYALRVTEAFQGIIENMGYGLDGLKLLELGPGINFGPQLILTSLGAEVSLADRFLAAWDPGYHPHFYQMLADKIDGPKDALLQVICDEDYSRALTLYNEPAESLETVPDKHFDIVISNAVLEHVFDLAAVAKQLKRVTKIGGMNTHQIDFRDHRNFEKPLEFLLIEDSIYEREFFASNCERGNRIRPKEAVGIFEHAGFEIINYYSNLAIDEQYLREFIVRLRSSASRFSAWPEDDLRSISGQVRVRATRE